MDARQSPAVTERGEIHVSAALIIDATGRLLVVRKRGTRMFMQPGGKPEPGESPAETLARELNEELGLSIGPAELRPLGAHRAAAANEANLDVVAEVFELEAAGLSPVAKAEIAELRWIGAAELERMRDQIAPLIQVHFAQLLR